MSIKHAKDVPAEPVTAGQGTTRQVLIGSEVGPHFAMRLFVIQPGGGMPRHTNTVEHEQYVLRGHARIGIGNVISEVKADDVVFIPAGVPHWYETLGEEPFEFICVVPNLEDKVELVDKPC